LQESSVCITFLIRETYEKSNFVSRSCQHSIAQIWN